MKNEKGNWKFFIIGALVFIIFIFPLYWMVVTALKTQVEIFQIPTPLWPKDLTLDAFAAQLSASSDTLRGFKNSLIIGCGATLISTILSIPAAYGLARFKFSGRKVLILYFLMTQMLPSTLILTSLYIMFSNMGLLNTYLAPILADATLGIPFSIIILRTYFLSIPKELDEAAKIDGCNAVQTLVKVIVPMLSPAITSIALFQFMWSSNDFMGPLLYVNTPAKYPLAIFVKMSMDADSGFQWNRILALSLISIIPSLVVFFMAQDKFVDGISAGGVKG